MQVGLGVTIGSITPVFSQGAIENTRVATNVAIQGNGFFVSTAPAARRTRAPATSASTTTAAGDARTASACRATRAIDPVTGADRHHGPAERHHRAAGRAARARRDDAVLDRSRTSTSARRRQHVHHVGPDLRLARRLARRRPSPTRRPAAGRVGLRAHRTGAEVTGGTGRARRSRWRPARSASTRTGVLTAASTAARAGRRRRITTPDLGQRCRGQHAHVGRRRRQRRRRC